MPSAVFDHTISFYNLLAESAKEEELEDGTQVQIFRGSITNLYRSLGVSQSYYSQVRKALIELGCIAILQQGARNTDSVVAVHHPPDGDELEVNKSRLTPNLNSAILSQRVDDINRLVGGIHLPDALADHEKRLRTIEREVKRLGAKPKVK